MNYILNRILSMLLTLFLISIITFAVTNILPGDVAMMIMGIERKMGPTNRMTTVNIRDRKRLGVWSPNPTVVIVTMEK